MRRQALLIAVATAIFGLAAACVLSLASCAAHPSPSQTAEVAAYQARELACIAEAGIKVAADECRCNVKAAYFRDCDGGVP